MANQANIEQVNNFVGGLNTEASPLNFPPNASLDEANMVLNIDGTRQRRLGLSLESYAPGSALDASGNYTGQFKGFRWDSVGGDANLSIQVVQMAGCIVFFNNTRDTLIGNEMGCIDFSVTGNKKMEFAVVNGDLIVATGETNPYVVTYDSGGSFSYEIISPKIRDLFGVDDGLQLTERPQTLSNTHEYNLRNQGWPSSFYLGEDNGYGDPIQFFEEQVGVFPSNSDEFQYGIVPVKDPGNTVPDEKFKPVSCLNADTGSTQAPKGHFIIDAFNRGQSRVSQNDFEYTEGTSRKESYSVSTTCDYDPETSGVVCDTCVYTFPDTLYPLENTHLDVYNLKVRAFTSDGLSLPDPQYNRVQNGDALFIDLIGSPPCGSTGFKSVVLSRIEITYSENHTDTSYLTLPQDKDTGRPTTVAAMGNRIFYSGVRSSLIDGDKDSVRYTGMVFFSKVAQTKDDLDKCYQLADPTSRKISDLVDTDGGHINITEADNILKLVALDQSLIVIAENGVWQISGGDSGFLATEYIIHKLSDVGCVNKDSVVVVEDSIMYWTESSIYHISMGQTGTYDVKSLTEDKIRSLISSIDKDIVVGVYDKIKKVVRWMYQKYERELIFDLNIQAFYKNTYPKRWIRGYVDVPEYTIDYEYQNIQVGDIDVYVDNYEIVYGFQARGAISSGIKYITVNPIDKWVSFSLFNNTDFTDWYGYNYDSYLITGFNTSGDIVGKKTSPYLFFYLTRTEDGFELDNNGNLVAKNESSCWVQTMWDWTGSGSSGKWGAPFQAYRYLRPYIPSGVNDTFDYGENIIVTKNKILGRGRSLSLKISSEDGKDLQLLGWARTITNTTVP